MSETAATTPGSSSFVEDLFDFWTKPSAVFVRRARRGFLLMMGILTVGFGALFMANRGAMQGIMDAEFRRGAAQMRESNPSVTEEQMAQGRAMTERFSLVGAFLIAPIVLFCLGLAVWLCGKIFGAEEVGYGTAVTIAAWGYLPRLVEGIVTTLQGMVLDTSTLTGRYQLSLGVARFLDPEMNAGVLAFLGRVDVFTIWVSILLGIGIVAVGKLPREKVPVVAAAMWVFGALPALVQLAMGAARG